MKFFLEGWENFEQIFVWNIWGTDLHCQYYRLIIETTHDNGQGRIQMGGLKLYGQRTHWVPAQDDEWVEDALIMNYY